MSDLEFADFFGYRTALLSRARFNEIDRRLFNADGEPGDEPVSWLLQENDLCEALLAASPNLFRKLIKIAHASQESPDTETSSDEVNDHDLRPAIWRYMRRMSGRATPFGMFAAMGVGYIGMQTCLPKAGGLSVERHIRLDMEALRSLCSNVAAASEKARFSINESIVVKHDHFRFIRREPIEAGEIRSSLMRVTRSPALDLLVDKMQRTSLTRNEMRSALQAERQSDRHVVDAFLQGAIDLQFLTPDIMPTVYGDDTLSVLTGAIAEQDPDAPVLAVLRSISACIDAVGRDGRITIGDVAGIEAELSEARITPPKSVLHVDAYLPGEEPIVLAEKALSIIRKKIESLGPVLTHANAPLASFTRRFEKRYGSAFAPLIDALDDDTGLGFSDFAKGVAPLAKGLGGAAGSPPSVAWNSWQTFLADRMHDAARAGVSEIELSDEDIAVFNNKPSRFPSAFAILGAVHACNDRSIDAGDFLFEFKYAAAPDSAALMGRFCNGHSSLLAKTRELCRREEDALTDDVVYAEIVHVPEGRVGNVIQRPRLRACEISYFGSSTGEATRLSIQDLQIGVRRGELVLWSGELGKRVVPRLSNAHNYAAAANLPVYRFLALLQGEGDRAVRFNWGGLSTLRFLPRVRCGNIVLSRARWTLSRNEIKVLYASESPRATSDATRALFSVRGIPEVMELVQGDNIIEFDIRVPAQARIFVEEIRNLGTATVQEAAGALFEARETAVNEVVLLGRAGGKPPAVAGKALVIQPIPAEPASFAPGGEWLYAKIYTGPAAADRIISGPLLSVLENAATLGCRSGFFIRYRDPDHHIRLRINGAPAILWGAILNQLTSAVAPLMADQSVSRFTFDTYLPELDRYGGKAGMAEAEALFTADSFLIAGALGSGRLSGRGDVDERWKLAVSAVSALCEVFDAAVPGSGRQALDAAADTMLAEFKLDKPGRKALNMKFRENRDFVSSVLNGALVDPAVSHLGDALATYKASLAAPARRLAARFDLAELRSLVQSYAHMTNNRIFQDNARLQELVVYDMLRRGWKGLEARRRYDRTDNPAGKPSASAL